MTKPDSLRVGILGGGLAGVILFRGLMKLDHLDVHIFESRPIFCEEGAGIAMQYNATSALRAIDPDLLSCLHRAGAVRVERSKHFMGAGPDAGALLRDTNRPEGMDTESSQWTCYRQAFLTQLLAPIPSTRLHASKRLCRLDDSKALNGGKLTLEFEDGTADSFDVIFGADGVNGKLRRYVLGDHPSVEAVPVGQWHLPLMVPMTDAKTAFGDALDEYGMSQKSWIGYRTFVMHDFHDNRESVQLVIASGDEEVKRLKLKRKTISHADFKELLSGQLPFLSEGVVNVVCKHTEDPITAYCQFAHAPAPTIVRQRVCLVGDAAHSTSPSQASGGGMSCEDACILTALLTEARTLEEVELAFQAYDIVRRPRCDAIIASSEKTGEVFTGAIGVDKDVVADYLTHAWDVILSWRADVEVANVLELYHALQKNARA